mgnify:CR=1 FL=1
MSTFKTATGSSSFANDANVTEYTDIDLAFVSDLGRVIAVESSHNVGLVFENFSLSLVLPHLQVNLM